MGLAAILLKRLARMEAIPLKTQLRFFAFLAARVAGMALLAGIPPFAYYRNLRDFQGDGQQAFGFLMGFAVVGIRRCLCLSCRGHNCSFFCAKESTSDDLVR
jgi:hypothetical protein